MPKFVNPFGGILPERRLTHEELVRAIRLDIAGDVIKAPALKKGGVLLASGRQYCSLVVGQDMNIGYNGPSGDRLEFSVSESLAFLISSPGAICVLH